SRPCASAPGVERSVRAMRSPPIRSRRKARGYAEVTTEMLSPSPLLPPPQAERNGPPAPRPRAASRERREGREANDMTIILTSARGSRKSTEASHAHGWGPSQRGGDYAGAVPIHPSP